MTPKTDLADLAQEMLALESETFEINDYPDTQGVLLNATAPAATAAARPARWSPACACSSTRSCRTFDRR
ncbi:thiazolylpeptide-type bacteriocin precursor [Streptomyces puniciscabiei]|uniref:Thiazolylpeptide-type bacteriocin n=1 Tax=Streptomyces puniciscabiei TaxID=164348 RepID=A0A542UH98_9ACTN|nr:lantibiotic protein [Streptomyces puniciscabiei]TQK98431.1 thiazolylpeptide-type bacteriocin precursor [Streptomyces puniciscabiei]